MSSSAPKMSMTSSASRFRALARLVSALGLGALATGCEADLAIKNAAPAVTWVAVGAPDADGVAEITLWVADVEGDTVDVAAAWLSSTGERTPLAQAQGTYGLTGLPTRDALNDPAGQPHRVLWDTTDVPAGATIRLSFVPDDMPYDSDGLGAEAQSPAFDVEVGLPEPVELE